MARLNLFLLGAPRVELDGKPIDLSRRKVLAILIYLAVTRQPQRRDTLATLFWPESGQEAARASLRRELFTLTSALGEGWIESDREGVALADNAPISLDVTAFRQHLTACRSHGHAPDEVCAACLEPLTAAVALYQGDFLAGFTLSDSPEFDDWQFFHADTVRRELADALEKLVRLHRQRGEYDAAITYARRWLLIDALHEPVHRMLMQLYAWAGQQAAALRQYQECVRLLNEELGVEPEPETIALFEAIRARRLPEPNVDKVARRQEPVLNATKDDKVNEDTPLTLTSVSSVEPTPLHPVTASPRHNLPSQATRFIGRTKELSAIDALFFDDPTCRLLTLLGPGGIGKTRLALEAATARCAIFADGVWLVELAPLADPALIPQTVTSTLGAPEAPGIPVLTSLSNHLRTKQLLIVLDNCEHLIDACAHLVDTLLRSCPQVRLLVTSRESLAIAGESCLPVPPLAFPDPQQLLALDQLPHYEAIGLFLDRAKAVAPDFQITTTNAAALVQLCRWLDGIPLALELAAARIRMLQVEQIAARLDNRFRLLTGGSRSALPRHQTLRALIDWSYDLLADAERIIFQGLATFAGGWTLAAAEALFVASSSAGPSVPAALSFTAFEVFDLLSQLVNKSLVIADRRHGAETRYRMLETIRQYAGEKLLAAGHDAPIGQRHLTYFLALTEEAAAELRGPAQVAWLDRLAAEHDNLRAAFEWALAYDSYAALQMAAQLLWFWHIRNHNREGRDWLQRALTAEAQQRGPHSLAPTHALVRARALYVAGFLAQMALDWEQATEWAQASLTLYQELGSPGRAGVAYALLCLSGVAVGQGRREQAIAMREEALAIFREVGDRFGMAECVAVLGHDALAQGDYARAQHLGEENLLLRKQLGDMDGAAFGLSHLATVAYWQGDAGRARSLAEESLANFRLVGNQRMVGYTLAGLSDLARALGDYEQALVHSDAGLRFGYEAADKGVIGSAYYRRGNITWSQGEYQLARQHYQESLTLLRAVANLDGVARVLRALGEVACTLGEYASAIQHYEEALPISRAANDAPNIAATLCGLGKVAHKQGELLAARVLLKEALAVRSAEAKAGKIFWPREKLDLAGVPCLLEVLAAVLTTQLQMAAAARLFGATEQWHQIIHFVRSPAERSQRERDLAAVQAKLGEAAFRNSWAAGCALALEEALAYALEVV